MDRFGVVFRASPVSIHTTIIDIMCYHFNSCLQLVTTSAMHC